jgi:uncharacterized protein (UPF0261 family)
MVQSIYAVATMDTKGRELAYVADCMRAARLPVVTVDVGTCDPPVVTPDVDRGVVAACHPAEGGATLALSRADRGQAITAMSHALECYLRREYQAGRVLGVIGIGGSGGTALVTAAMRALPVGLPKLMVSTVASGNIASYVGVSDITIMPSVVDIAGLNAISRRVLGNAANAIAGMVQNQAPVEADKPTLGMSMFGVTTPCVTAVRETLEARGYDCLVFHATGIGGQAMEKLVEAGMIHGVIDITTTEVADEIVGGILPCGPLRFDVILGAGIPFVLSVGALDMVNFGAIETVPERFRRRLLHVHNPQVTLMRTTPEENRRCARWIATKLNRARSAFRILIPEEGVSALDAPGQPFHDPAADAALFDELELAVQAGPDRLIRRFPLHINDPAFAQELVKDFFALCPAFSEVSK